MSFHDLIDRPVAFQRAFVALGAGITGALMLSQAVYWSTRTKDTDGWFYKTMKEWEAETGMTRSEQESARKKLVNIGVLEEMKKGVPCRLFYRVNVGAIQANLLAETPQSSLQESLKQGRRKPASRAAEKPKAITENTQETTAETTAGILPVAADAAHGEGQLSAAPRVEIPSDMPGPKDQACKTFKAWANYAFAYRKRYGIWPVWNAKAGGQLGQLIDRLGTDAAPQVAAYYLTISDAQVIRDCHSLNILIAKAEAIHTQWVTGRQMNATTARQQERTAANLDAAQTAAKNILEKSGGSIYDNPFYAR